MTNEIRVRYAPSPTGDLHIGNARTALFNYLYARHFNGKFIIRTEDTDSKRNIAGGEESQLTYLKWLGIERSEEHTSELQSRGHLVCRLLLEKKKKANEKPLDIHRNHYGVD